MILSFRSRPLERLWEKSDARGLDPQHIRKIQLILDRLEVASGPEMMNIPQLKLHKLSGEVPARWSVRVNGNWRITFSFDGEDVIAVDYEDYH
ncbi:MAG: type II toxin-antitoxin system RelE/ParE family toxin [Rhizobiaceae bacterium]|nr:type II toxin-antitoxin system RelE/ParE family toxin [Rhizobiaceae bacterium]